MTIRAQAEMRFEFDSKSSRGFGHNGAKYARHGRSATLPEKQIPLSVTRAAGAAKNKERATTLGMTILFVGS
jgi:hypothetical protein